MTNVVWPLTSGREAPGTTANVNQERDLRLGEGAELDFAQEALRALGGDHGDGVGDVLRGEDFAGVFRPAAGKFSGHAARADGADANAVSAQILGHAAAEALYGPLRRAIKAAAGEGVFAGQRTDIDDVAGLARPPSGNNRAGNQEQTLQIGV